MAHHLSGPELEADMGVRWIISAGKVFGDGCTIREIIARGHMKASTPVGGVASAGLAWTSAVGAGLRALATARPLPQHCSLLIGSGSRAGQVFLLQANDRGRLQGSSRLACKVLVA